MEVGVSGRLVSTEIHGFHTLRDLDVTTILDEAKTRWLRPNEIHAILTNYKYFPINAKPMQFPKSGTIVLFDRKMLRNFRKDGYNWKKKKDGKTINEAHEHLKVGNEERIHVYYAHGQDNPTFVRRCYWLLDKSLEHIVLVHYRETQELQDSPGTPVNSNSSSLSDQSAPWPSSEELDSGAVHAFYTSDEGQESSDILKVRNHQIRLHEINTLEWDELVTNESNNSISPERDTFSHINQENQNALNGSHNYDSLFPAREASPNNLSMGSLVELIEKRDDILYSQPNEAQSNADLDQRFYDVPGTGDSLEILASDGLQRQASFGRWMNYVIADSLVSSEGAVLESSVPSRLDLVASPLISQDSSILEQMFIITDVSPAWAFSTETTKILITGFFIEQCRHMAKSNLFCVCGDVCTSVENVQDGVYRCFVSPHSPGIVNLYLSLDQHKPISQVLNFEYCTRSLHDPVISLDHKSQWEDFQVQIRLVKLLLTTSKSLAILTGKVPPNNVKEAKKFALKTSYVSDSWAYLVKSAEDNRIPFTEAKDSLFELTLKNILKEWLLERVIEGCKTTEYDSQGLGVIHLCAILGYTWAVQLFSLSGFSLDFRDKHGWTALHWAAYCGRDKMVAVLLAAGSKPSRVTDPTLENPGGCTPADLASAKGFEGLAAYLSEKALVSHFEDMSSAGNVSGSLQMNATDLTNSENLTEEELYLKDTLAAYRTAADAASRIQAAFREHSLKIRTKAVWVSNPEEESRNIIAAMQIQHAFRNFESRRKMAAAARIQYRFRTWKMRKDFLNMRRQVIKIQAACRGYQARRQYCKIIWSVGVLEKVILRWRLKRKGCRGLQIDPVEEVADERHESDAEEDFYRASRKQAEERVERAVIRVQATFPSKKAQREYRQMKMAHNQATLEYNEFLDPDADMDG